MIVSLLVLFAATAIGVVVIRVQLGAQGKWPADLPAVPPALLISTLLLLGSSARLAQAQHHGAGAARQAIRGAVIQSAFLGMVFVAVQAVGWVQWADALEGAWRDSDSSRLAVTGFYVLTGIHALHVIGGLVAFLWALRAGGADSAPLALRVRWCALYWHFLGAVWILILALLFLIR